MDSRNGGGVKVTYIETQFVTSDEAGFKDLVQRLTGRSAPAPPHAPHWPRPRPRRTDGGGGTSATTAAGGAGAAVAGPQGYGYAYHHYYPAAAEVGGQAAGGVSRAPPCLQELRPRDDDAANFFDLFCYDAGAGQRQHAFSPSREPSLAQGEAAATTPAESTDTSTGMDGVKVTYIETRFVTSDAAGFKDLVQRLTGSRPAPPPAAPAATAPDTDRRCYHASSSSAAPAAAAAGARVVAGCGPAPPPCLAEDACDHIGDLFDLLHASSSSATGQRHSGQGGGYSGYYFPC
ncbi:hypothetical protein U9M48_025010 [Paspalum notatum var. saurae]|uniref:VQ domain-containing protein n=1 Tax=Paspalum notatum var. saurae TaxID=547442 RepID=A0AAQ3TRT0_PASNO